MYTHRMFGTPLGRPNDIIPLLKRYLSLAWEDDDILTWIDHCTVLLPHDLYIDATYTTVAEANKGNCILHLTLERDPSTYALDEYRDLLKALEQPYTFPKLYYHHFEGN